MKKIVILSSDTAHHRYFINSILIKGIEISCCMFETKHVQAPFPTGPLFEKEEERFEEDNFFHNVSRKLPEDLIREVKTVNSMKSSDWLKQINPDFGIVFGTGKISREVIDLFKDGLVNVHRGISEKYRGLNSDLWAIYHKDYENIGVTIHKVDPLLDTGDIVSQEKMPLKPGMKTHQIRYYTTLIATRLVIESTLDYLSGDIRHVSQKKKGRYYSFMPLELKKIVNEKFNKYCANLE